ncbi:hypothetical protein [uncultured Brachyspira sp.]|uniref:hypothetical protein n=1 Tax=uncultured Brachyspira sp. TaxID=221953 RepID=UPI0025E0CE01|nr:hypothetical protein [uncultured Brachyspira sp.]
MLITFCGFISDEELYKSFNIYKTLIVSSTLPKLPSIVNSFPLGYMETSNFSSNMLILESLMPHIEIKDSLSLNFTLLSNIFLLIIQNPSN